MKTFDKKDLITWSNRHKVKVGDKGYFADSITDLHSNMTAGYVHELMSIFDNNNRCFSDGIFSYGFFLPVEAVKDNEPKKYRACKTIQELCKLVTGNTSIQSNEQCSLYLVSCKLHIRNKSSNGESYLAISGIYIYDYEIAIKLDSVSYCFNDLFETYEIEINGKWQPFGILEN